MRREAVRSEAARDSAERRYFTSSAHAPAADVEVPD